MDVYSLLYHFIWVSVGLHVFVLTVVSIGFFREKGIFGYKYEQKSSDVVIYQAAAFSCALGFLLFSVAAYYAAVNNVSNAQSICRHLNRVAGICYGFANTAIYLFLYYKAKVGISLLPSNSNIHKVKKIVHLGMIVYPIAVVGMTWIAMFPTTEYNAEQDRLECIMGIEPWGPIVIIVCDSILSAMLLALFVVPVRRVTSSSPQITRIIKRNLVVTSIAVSSTFLSMLWGAVFQNSLEGIHVFTISIVIDLTINNAVTLYSTKRAWRPLIDDRKTESKMNSTGLAAKYRKASRKLSVGLGLPNPYPTSGDISNTGKSPSICEEKEVA